MCKIGDIILIRNAKHNKRLIGQHPFLVLDDRNGIISGVYRFDLIGLPITSADTEEKLEQRNKPGYMFISKDEKDPNREKNKDGYIEANQFFYFDKNKISYQSIGRLNEVAFNRLVDFISNLGSNGITIEHIVDKATKIEISEESEAV